MKLTHLALAAVVAAAPGLALAGGAPVKPSAAQLQQQNEETMILNLLSGQGYHDVSNVQRNGNMYTAMATKDGKQMQVSVDPHAGTVTGM